MGRSLLQQEVIISYMFMISKRISVAFEFLLMRYHKFLKKKNLKFLFPIISRDVIMNNVGVVYQTFC